MTRSTAFQKCDLGFLELNLLHETLMEWCWRTDLAIQSPDGQRAAKALVGLYDLGVRESADFREALMLKPEASIWTNLRNAKLLQNSKDGRLPNAQLKRH